MTDPFLEKAKKYVAKNEPVSMPYLADFIAEFGKQCYEDGYKIGLKEAENDEE